MRSTYTGLSALVFIASVASLFSKPSETESALLLYSSSFRAYEDGRLMDAAANYYSAGLRLAYDRRRFPITGGDSKAVLALFAALDAQAGRRILQDLARHPATVKAVTGELAEWSPIESADYAPPWRYYRPETVPELDSEFENEREDLLTHLRQLYGLLLVPEYYVSLLKVQRSSTTAAGAFSQRMALEKMVAIEKEHGVVGIGTVLLRKGEKR